MALLVAPFVAPPKVLPVVAAALRSWIDVKHLVYALCTKVLRMGYVLFGNTSHVSNSFNGNMTDAISCLMALLMICLQVYGSSAIV
jgi:hypothetical protein